MDMMDAPSLGATCNICGANLDLSYGHAPDLASSGQSGNREAAGCRVCNSSVRLRSLIALLSQEIFGVSMALPEFPTLKGIRGIGMSDSPELATRLAEKFDYTNTFYHQAPVFDVTKPDARDLGRYDFILSSEVMEHVPPPVERAFQSLYAMLKPDGLLLMTTPYSIGGKTAERFPDLHEFALTRLGGKLALVNRRRDGSPEIFDDLVFHGGHGSTLEMRLFTAESLQEALREAGFNSVHFFAEQLPEYGIDHGEPFSLPIAARKGQFRLPAAELAREYRDAHRLAARKIRDLAILTAEYQSHVAYHEESQKRLEGDLAERTDWATRMEASFEERTRWALDLSRENAEAIRDFDHLASVEKELRQQMASLQKEVDRLESAGWTRLGRKLRMLDR
jgi:SAM-dependent methyltransferase